MYSLVQIRHGKLRGHRSDGMATFKGVPFAAPPFGANRLQPPRPVEPWDGVRDALASASNKKRGLGQIAALESSTS